MNKEKTPKILIPLGKDLEKIEKKISEYEVLNSEFNRLKRSYSRKKDKASIEALKVKAEIEDIKIKLKPFDGNVINDLKKERDLKNKEIREITKDIVEASSFEEKAEQKKLQKTKDALINEFFVNPDLKLSKSHKDYDLYLKYKDEIKSEVDKKIATEWNIEKSKLTDAMVSEFVLFKNEDTTMEEFKKRYGKLYTDELKSKSEKYISKLVPKKIKGEDLSSDEDKYINENTKLRDEYEAAVEASKNGELIKLDEIAKRENEKGEDSLNTEEKALKQKYIDIYNEKIDSYVTNQKELALALTKRRLAMDTTLNEDEIKLEEKYRVESLAKMEADEKAIKDLEAKRKEISQKIYKDKTTEGLFNEIGEIDMVKLKDYVSNNLNNEDTIFLRDNLSTIKEAVRNFLIEENKLKGERAEADNKAQREAFGAMNPEQKRAAAMERYQRMIENKKKQIEQKYGKDTAWEKAELDSLKYNALNKRESSHNRKIQNYNRNSEGLRNILNNKEYQKLSNMDAGKMNYDQKKALEVFVSDQKSFEDNLRKNGTAGNDYVSLEKNRAELAKKSQEFKGTFKRKFFSSKLLAGIGNMFGFKWSGVEETEATKDAQNAMHLAQGNYDNVKQKLMQGIVGEEQTVQNIWSNEKNLTKDDEIKAERKNISDNMQHLFSNVKREFINNEYEKLDELKHTLEGSVKKQAFEKFSIWQKEKYWNWIPEGKVRTIVKRLTNAAILSACLLPFSTAAAGAFIGNRVLRAAISGVAGESAASIVAGIWGGSKNDKGEFNKFADQRDREFNMSERDFVNNLANQIESGQKVNVNQGIMNKLKTDHENAVHNMQRKETNVRKGEMWARILAGGGSVWAFNHFDPGNIMVPGPAPEDGSVVPVPGPNPEDFNLEGDFVMADSKGFIQTFINLKEKMLDHYQGKPGFENMTDDQIVAKITSSGQFDQTTIEIMQAKSLQDFMEVAKDHGFWKPEGWNNPNIDSGSVPAGSRVGMELDSSNEMRLYVKLPDGKHIPIDDNFQEALSKHLKGVTMIDSDHLGSRAPASESNVSNGSNTGNELPPPDTSLDEGEFVKPPLPNAENSALSVDNTPGKVSAVKPPVYIETDFSNADNSFDNLKSYYDSQIENIEKQIKFNGQYQKPGLESDYYEKLGYNWKGKVGATDFNGIKGPSDQITEVYQGSKHYFAPGSEYLGTNPDGTLKEGWQPLKNTTMYQTYNTLERDYINAQSKIAYWEDQKIKTNIAYQEALNNQVNFEAQDVTDNTDPASGSTNEIIDTQIEDFEESKEALSNQWIDDAFGKDPLFGSHKDGIDTKAWDRIKDDTVADFLEQNKIDKDWSEISKIEPNDFSDTINPDDVYDPSDKEKLLLVMQRYSHMYNINPTENETVTNYIDRLSEVVIKNSKTGVL